MALSLSMGQRLSQSQELALGQKLELSQKLAETFETIRIGSGSSPGEVTKRVFAQILEGIENTEFQAALQTIVLADTFQAQLLRDPGIFATMSERILQRFSLRYIHEVSAVGGAYSYARAANGDILAEPPKTTLPLLIEAFEKPEEFNVKITEHIEMLRAVSRSTSTSMLDLHEMQDARTVVEHISGEVKMLSRVLAFLFSRKDGHNQSILKNFLMDVAVLEKLDCFASERLQKRFVKRFVRVRTHSQSDTFEEAMLNTIGEYTLVSMGIIAPEIFILSRGEIQKEMFAEIGKDLAKEGIDLPKLLAGYRLRSEGTFFFNRYHTLSKCPCAITDELIRKFITKTVREDRRSVLDAVCFEKEFFPNIVSVVEESDEEDREVDMRNCLINLLGDEAFQMKFLALLRGWYKYFDMFYR